MAKCTECHRYIPAVPGLVACGVAHVAPDGSPCLDGKREDEPCTTWGLTYAARLEHLTLPMWQLSNLRYLDL